MRKAIVEGSLVFGAFRLDLKERRLWKDQTEVSLTPKAFELLAYLACHAGEVLSREHLLEVFWPETYVDDHALTVQIRDIRKALGDDVHNTSYVETRHRRGYCFKAEVERLEPAEAAAPAAPADSPPDIVPTTKYARSGDVSIAYQVLGDGPIDLVFVMGWVSHLEYFWTEPSFARFLRQLASFSRLILFDKRGTGLSDRVPISRLPSLEQRMDDVRAVMNAVDSPYAVVCGISESGPMSVLFSATYPERTQGLIMIGTYAKRIRDDDYPWGTTQEERAHFLEEIRGHWGAPIGIEDRAPSAARDPAFREWWATYLRMGASPGAAVALTRMNAEIDVRAVLPTVRVPTLVIHRTGDTCLRVEEGRYVASRIPEARFVELPGEDHLPFVGDQDAVLGAMKEFLMAINRAPESNRVLASVLCMEFSEASGSGLTPERMQHIRLRLQPMVGREIKSYRGHDGGWADQRHIATFDGPARAVRCALSITSHANRLALTPRTGLHAGECQTLPGPGVTGLAVDSARCVLERAGWGEVLVSSTVRDLVAGSGLEFDSLGEISMPGLQFPVRLLRVL